MIWTAEDLQRFHRAEAKLAEVQRRLREDPPRRRGSCSRSPLVAAWSSCYWWHIELAHAREQLAARWN